MDNVEKQMRSIFESISSMALSDYSKKAIITNDNSQIDAIAAGINLLSDQIEKMVDELQLKTNLLNKSEQISHLGSWMLDLKTNTLIWSNETYRIFGLEPQEFKATYEAFLEHVHPDDRAMVNMAYSKSIEDNNEGYEIDHRIIRKHSGEVRYVREKCVHNRDLAGDIISSTGYVQDVTSIYKAQELIEKNENRLKTAQKIAKIGSWEVDFITNEMTWSDEMYNVFNLDPSKHTPSFDILLSNIHPEYRDLFMKRVNQAKSGTDQHPFDYLLNTEGNNEKWIKDQAEVIFNEDGVPIKAFGTAQDITESKKAFEKQKQLNDLKSRFVTTASHQFRTPMTVILSNAQLLDLITKKSDESFKPRLEKITARIQSEIVNMTGLMDDILILEKINSGENVLAVNKTSVDIVEFINNLSEAFNEVQSDGRLVEIEVSGSPSKILIDKKHMEHALNNLISNAFKYSKKGNPKVQIVFEDNFHSISISDTGIGIPKEDLPNIFQPFHRAHNVANIDGSGLGLSIAKEYVELNGGEIRAESVLNESTSIILTIPNS